MALLDWLILIVPLLAIVGAAFYTQRYIHDAVDFLAAGRIAGRYAISVADLASGLSIITLVALSEQNYQCGFGVAFWNSIGIPVGIAMSLTGYCNYRWRQTRCLSRGQFIELRYGSKFFRVVTAVISTTAESVTNAIGPAIAARFFIYYLGLPHRFTFFGISLPCYGIVVVLCLTLAILLIWPSGRISLLITDCFQGLLTYPIFIILAGFILLKFSWDIDVLPVLINRAPQQSFVDPHQIRAFRDFNIFMITAELTSGVINRASWFGNDTTNSGRTPHEQKMAGILGAWRATFANMIILLIALMVYVFMTSGNFANRNNVFKCSNNEIRRELTTKIMDELHGDGLIDQDKHQTIQQKIDEMQDIAPGLTHSARPIAQIPNDTYQDGAIRHQEILVRKADGAIVTENPEDGSIVVCDNLDKHYFDVVYSELGQTPSGRSAFQQYRSKFQQMMMPVCLKNMFPIGLQGLFCLLAVMLLISTDDTRIFNAVGSIVQDIVLPYCKTRPTPEKHILLLRIWTILVGVFFFVVSMFFSQMDYIIMFTTIMSAVWLGAAGPIMVGGLYTRFGNLTGAWCAIVFGSGSTLLGMICQFRWASTIYPWLEKHQLIDKVGTAFTTLSKPFHPYIQWEMNAVRFPINSYEIFFFAMLISILTYTIGSFLTYKPYNLDKLLHRGKYADEKESPASLAAPENITSGKPGIFRRIWTFIQKNMLGIDSEYTRGDKIIAYSVFTYVIIYKFLIIFLGVFIYTKYISPWSQTAWGNYFLIVQIIIPIFLGLVTTVWFVWGTIKDIRQLFSDLENRKVDTTETGQL
ncbi:MAG: sodium:panthothenate symporter [Oligosphaeraceae bacterium]|nr:sodium:panthothenate symporter [Oligosphaeraceae bacterium]